MKGWGVIAACVLVPAMASASPATVSPAALANLITRCAPNVAPATMLRIVQHESAGDPLAIHVNGPQQLEHQPANNAEAVITAAWLIQHHYNIDVGLGQINSDNLAHYKLPLAIAFDACRNLSVAADVLQQGYGRAVSGGAKAPLTTALSYYNTGSPTAGIANGYAAHVLATPIPLQSTESTGVIKLLHAKVLTPTPVAAAPVAAPAWDVFSHTDLGVYNNETADR